MKSHEKALTEKGPRKRIMEKASTIPNRKSKNPDTVKNHRGSVLLERKPLQGSRITEARYSEKENLYKDEESVKLEYREKESFRGGKGRHYYN